jgi:hypothetical protein
MAGLKVLLAKLVAVTLALSFILILSLIADRFGKLIDSIL